MTYILECCCHSSTWIPRCKTKTNDSHKLCTNQSITNTYKERVHAYGVTQTSFFIARNFPLGGFSRHTIKHGLGPLAWPTLKIVDVLFYHILNCGLVLLNNWPGLAKKWR